MKLYIFMKHYGLALADKQDKSYLVSNFHFAIASYTIGDQDAGYSPMLSICFQKEMVNIYTHKVDVPIAKLYEIPSKYTATRKDEI